VQRKLLLAATATFGVFALATSAAASVVYVTNVGVTSNNSSFDHLDLSQLGGGPDLNSSVWAPGILFTEETSIGGPTTTDLVFCVDLEHNIGVQGYPNPTPLVFDTGFIVKTGGGAPLAKFLGDTAISNEIGHLAELGQYIYKNKPDYDHQLVAVQGAIWSLEYGVGGGRAHSSNVAIDQEIAHLVMIQPSGTKLADGLLSDPHNVQNMAFGGVPEPASWALMIGGFGMAGAALRRRRSAPATA
jgi:hypothetical protein